MSEIQVVTGSEASLSLELAKEFGIEVIPFYLNYQNKSLKEGVDFKTEAFYQELLDIDHLPSSSPPSVGDVIHFLEKILQQNQTIILFTLSAQYSQFYNTCIQAVKKLEQPSRVYVFDSLGATAYEAMMAIMAARLAKQNKPCNELIQFCQDFPKFSDEFIVMDTLKYLAKGGRIGKVRAMMGSLLSIKPVIAHREGMAHPIGKVRTHPQGFEMMKQEIHKKLEKYHYSKINFLIQGILMDEWISDLEKLLENEFPVANLWKSRVSAIPSIHYGPKSWSIAYCIEF